MNGCLDSWAVLAWLDDDEPAATRVDAAIEAGAALSWINAVEVYYRLERLHGRAEADDTLAALRRLVTFDLPGPALMIEAARLKATHAIALGDCFAVAAALARGWPLLTGDPEILHLSPLPCQVEDLRPPG